MNHCKCITKQECTKPQLLDAFTDEKRNTMDAFELQILNGIISKLKREVKNCIYSEGRKPNPNFTKIFEK